MFSENLKTTRKAKGLSQEELAIRLNVVRQTVSKWEKGLSVPDADLLIRISEIFEVPVSKLLGATIEEDGGEETVNAVAEQLSRINEQLAIKNRRSRRIWKTVAIIFVAIVGVNILLVLFNTIPSSNFQNPDNVTFTGEMRLISPLPNITIAGVRYVSNGEIITADVADLYIVGYIEASMVEWFNENYRTNPNLIGAPYARHGDGIVVQWENRVGQESWLLFVQQ